MADEQKQTDSKGETQKTSEAGAADLLSLWGGAKPNAAKPQQPPGAPPPKPTVSPAAPTVQQLTAAPATSVPKEKPPEQPKEPQKPKPPVPEQKPEKEKPSYAPPPLKLRQASEGKPKEKARPKQEVLEGEVVTKKEARPTETLPEFLPESSPEPEEGGGFREQFDEFLAELNLGRRHIFYGLGCIILVAILAIGGIYGFRYFKDRKQSPKPKQSTVETTTKVQGKIEETGISESIKIGKEPAQPENLIKDTGLKTNLAIGQEQEAITGVAEYILTFRRLQNAYGTNVDELLNKSTDRRDRLASYLALLRKLHADGTEITKEITAELDRIKIHFEEAQKKQEIADSNFFEQLKALNAKTADDILNDFISVSREIIDLRARFKALQSILELYERGLPRVAARIKDIELNEEPLIAGIKVYDVPGSTLDLIVPVEGEPGFESEASDSFNAPAFPLFPTHPEQVKTEKDYITPAGGGFEEVLYPK